MHLSEFRCEAVPSVLGIACYCVQPSCFTGANAVFIRQPAVKHVAKATPGGVAGRDKRQVSLQQKIQRKTKCCPPNVWSLSPSLSRLLSLSALPLQPRSKNKTAPKLHPLP